MIPIKLDCFIPKSYPHSFSWSPYSMVAPCLVLKNAEVTFTRQKELTGYTQFHHVTAASVVNHLAFMQIRRITGLFLWRLCDRQLRSSLWMCSLLLILCTLRIQLRFHSLQLGRHFERCCHSNESSIYCDRSSLCRFLLFCDNGIVLTQLTQLHSPLALLPIWVSTKLSTYFSNLKAVIFFGLDSSPPID